MKAAEGQDDVIEHVVDQLQPFTTYEFAVAAATAAGQGRFSNPSSVRMPQEGKQRQEGHVCTARFNPDCMHCSWTAPCVSL